MNADRRPPLAIELAQYRIMAELELRERRLGTPAEAPDDFGRVRELAHELNNLLTITMLRRPPPHYPA